MTLEVSDRKARNKIEGSEFQSGITSANKRGFKRCGLDQGNEKWFVRIV